MARALIVQATRHDPWHNLAFEAYLQEELEKGAYAAILYLWQNDHTVVIGRNQNAWAECNTGRLEAEGGRLARRSTGGGAVYHDLGNLNFSIILPRDRFSIDDNFNLLLAVVATQGIAAERSGRNDILVNGLKFSGNAFSLKRLSGLHHGTFLVRSDYTRLARYLTVASDKLQAKGVKSVRSRVTNLQSIEPSITINGLKQAMQHHFCRTFCPGNDWIAEEKTDAQFLESDRLQTLHAHYADWRWRYGETVAFDVSVAERFRWGHIELGFLVCKGLVTAAWSYSDALDSDYIASLPGRLEGCRFHSPELAAALLSGQDDLDSLLTPRRKMASDIAALIRHQDW